MQLKNLIYLSILLSGIFISCGSDGAGDSNSRSTIFSSKNPSSNLFSNVSGLNGVTYLNEEYELLFRDVNSLEKIKTGRSADLINWSTSNGLDVVEGTEVNESTISNVRIIGNEIIKDSSILLTSNVLCYSNGQGDILINGKKRKGLSAAYFKPVTGTKVFWHKPSSHWVMLLSTKDQVLFYRSPDLESWEFTNNFGSKDGYHGSLPWHSPDIFELAVNNNPAKKKWVLVVSTTDGHPTKLGGTQYFVGDFNGKVFVNSNLFSKVLWLDWGADHINAQSVFNPITNEQMMIGIMNSNKYESQKNSSKLTTPRKLALKDTYHGLKLFAEPIKAFEKRRGSKISQRATKLSDKENALTTSITSPTEMYLEFSQKSNEGYTIEFSNNDGETLDFGYNGIRKMYLLNRMNAGKGIYPNLLKKPEHYAPKFSTLPKINVRIILDKNSIEIFADDGLSVFSELIFLKKPFNKLKLWGTTGQITMDKMDIYQLNTE